MSRNAPKMSSTMQRSFISATGRLRPVCRQCGAASFMSVYVAKPTVTGSLCPTRSGPCPPSTQRNTLGSQALRSGFATHASRNATDQNEPSLAARRSPELSSTLNMMAYLENSTAKILSHERSIPAEADVKVALDACRVVADYMTGDTVQPQIAHMVSEMDSSAKNLLSLGLPSKGAGDEGITAQAQRIQDKIADTAYAILSHPTVAITPDLLEEYVKVQSHLGRPETLPRVFHMFANKSLPRKTGSASLEFTDPDPNKPASAIDPNIVESALDVALKAKNLDAAVGIVENSYATKAFVRSKVIRQAMLPAATVVATPVAAYGLATSFSGLQDALDPATATNVAFVGILAYVGFTASLGLVALTTANDQMRRVSWLPGVPLRHRWAREEERAALDKIACAWGFQEEWRFGEESGKQWENLREYILGKDMVLDSPTLLMEDA